MQLSLEHAPDSVAEDVWLNALPGEPHIGDLWLLSWNNEVLGLALVTGVGPSFVLVWPVTVDDA